MDSDLLKDIQNINHKLLDAVLSMPPVKLGGIEVVVELLHNTSDPSQYDTGLHKHSHYELSMMLHGIMDYVIKGNNVKIDAEEHNIIFIPPETLHRRVVRHAHSVITGFQIQINALDIKCKSFVHNFPQLLQKSGYRFPGSLNLISLLTDMLAELETGKPFFNERVILFIEEFLLILFRECFSLQMEQLEKSRAVKQADNFHEHIVLSACRYIEEHLARHIHIDEIAQYCGLSTRHLNRIFVKYKHLSLGNYLILRKIDEAKKRIMRNDCLIKDIAYELGFANISYFCRLFKKVTGKTPENYRNVR